MLYFYIQTCERILLELFAHESSTPYHMPVSKSVSILCCWYDYNNTFIHVVKPYPFIPNINTLLYHYITF